LKAADTSLVVAAFASWHESHAAARRALDGGLRLIEHCALETYSVLTRLPPPHRTSGKVVRDFLTARFPQPFLRLSEHAHKDFILALPDHGVTGGAADHMHAHERQRHRLVRAGGYPEHRVARVIYGNRRVDRDSTYASIRYPVQNGARHLERPHVSIC
jgi:hypothetical protein